MTWLQLTAITLRLQDAEGSERIMPGRHTKAYQSWPSSLQYSKPRKNAHSSAEVSSRRMISLVNLSGAVIANQDLLKLNYRIVSNSVINGLESRPVR
jgi:hypothetical protein